LYPLQTYHVYNHAKGSDNLYREKKNYTYFLSKWEEHIDPVAKTIAYCLMPNHFHALVEVRNHVCILLEMVERQKFNIGHVTCLQGFIDLKSMNELKQYLHNLKQNNLTGNLEGNLELEKLLSKYVVQQYSNLFNGYTKAFNKVYSRNGSLFTSNFKRNQVKDYLNIRNVIRYVHLNPVHHHFTKHPNDWPFSSWHDYKEEKDFASSRMAQYYQTFEVFYTSNTPSPPTPPGSI